MYNKEDSVVLNRESFVGGSSIPQILNISDFGDRWGLLKFMAGLEEKTFFGNEYTRYGDVMEPLIRDWVNDEYGREFVPDVKIDGRLRGNTDGVDEWGILEVKTTSHIHETLDEYKPYIVQMLFYMALFKKSNGYLAVYERPEDFDETFDPTRLHVYFVDLNDWIDLAAEVEDAVDEFLKDLDRLKENPLLSEEDFLPKEIVNIGNEVVRLEQALVEMKAMENELKELKEDLKSAMKGANIKSWKTPNGTRITLVADGEDKTVEEFDTKRFISECPKLANEYMKITKKKGRKGYVKITL